MLPKSVRHFPKGSSVRSDPALITKGTDLRKSEIRPFFCLPVIGRNGPAVDKIGLFVYLSCRQARGRIVLRQNQMP